MNESLLGSSTVEHNRFDFASEFFVFISGRSGCPARIGPVLLRARPNIHLFQNSPFSSFVCRRAQSVTKRTSPIAPASSSFIFPEADIRFWLLTAHMAAAEVVLERGSVWADRMEAGPMVGYAFSDIQIDSAPTAPLLTFTHDAVVVGSVALKSALLAAHNATTGAKSKDLSNELAQQFRKAWSAADPNIAPLVPSAVRTLWADLGSEATKQLTEKFSGGPSWDDSVCEDFASAIVGFVKAAATRVPPEFVPLVLPPILSRIGMYATYEIAAADGVPGDIDKETRLAVLRAIGRKLSDLSGASSSVSMPAVFDALSGIPLFPGSMLKAITRMAPLEEESLVSPVGASVASSAETSAADEPVSLPAPRPRGP
jgi:hypothetical protein